MFNFPVSLHSSSNIGNMPPCLLYHQICLEHHSMPAKSPYIHCITQSTLLPHICITGNKSKCPNRDTTPNILRSRRMPSQSVTTTLAFDMEILYCICTNAVEKDEQLMNAGLFPSSFKQIDTAFTFTVLDDFLMDNLECKTTAQQYYSKLQSLTNRMFPDSVPVSWNSLTTLSFIL